ncbi:MAG: NAD(P)/FAD-dependent oxidoreductase, partial [Actinomycetota bacterium]
MRTEERAAQSYGSYSLWLDQMGAIAPRSALGSDLQVDVAIVGAGYTGLWTAYYLLRHDPSLRVALLEKEIAGFGASGRNGGWCSALFAASHDKIAKRYGRDAAIAMQRAMFDTIDEVGRAAADEGIDAHFHKGGTLTLVTAPTQLERVKGELEDDRAWGFGEGDFRWLGKSEVDRRMRVEGALGARYTPHCARIHPARLARGLAEAVERLGGTIYERTAVTEIGDRKLVTELGTVTADVVVRATEGYTRSFPGERRRLVPLYSLMIATEPLAPEVWDRIGWDEYETIHDGRHLLIYAQRTADDRIAIGGRGAPYHYGSRVDGTNERNEKVFT